MALLFSAVTVTSKNDQAEFLVSGIPKNCSDLEGWTAFDNLINEVDTEQEIQVHVAACLYGEGEPFAATPEEVAYLTRRAEADENFFYDHCKDAEHSAFSFTWSPGELFGNEHPRLVGHSVRGNKRLRSVQDVAEFICKHGQYGDVTVTYDDNKPFLSTFGIYLDRIVDMDYREELLKVLIPMQKEIDGTPDFEKDTTPSEGMEMN